MTNKKSIQVSFAAKTLSTALILAAIGFNASPAHAIYADVSTSGVIQSGIDTSGVFGPAGRDLGLLRYSMDLVFDSPGSFTFSTSSDATTSGVSTGSLTVLIGGITFTTAFTDSFGSYLEQTPHEITAFNTGDDTGGNALSVTNQFSTAVSLLPVNLGAPFSYTGGALDLAVNNGSVTFSVSGATENASFTATPSSLTYTVPEPASLGILAAGLAVIGIARRRTRERPSDNPDNAAPKSLDAVEARP